MGATTSSVRTSFASLQQTTITTTTTSKKSKVDELDSTPLSVRKLKVLVLGAPRVGKSGIVRRWLHNSFDSNIDSYIPTAKVDLSNKMMQVSDKVVQLEVWDTPSHPDIRDVMLDQYFRDADIVVLVGDVAKPASFRDLQANIVPQLAKYSARHYQGVLPVTVFLANKNDLQYESPLKDADPVGAVNVSEEVCQVMGDGCSAQVSALISAKLDWGVEDALERAVALALPLTPRVWQPLTAETLAREAEEEQRLQAERDAAAAAEAKAMAEEEKEMRRMEIEMLRAEGFAVSDDEEEEEGVVVDGFGMQVIVDDADGDHDGTQRVPLTPMVLGATYPSSADDSDRGRSSGAMGSSTDAQSQPASSALLPPQANSGRPPSRALYGSTSALTPRHEPGTADDDEFDEEEEEEEEEEEAVGGVGADGRPSTAPMKHDSPTRSPRKQSIANKTDVETKPDADAEAEAEAAAVVEADDDEFDEEEDAVPEIGVEAETVPTEVAEETLMEAAKEADAASDGEFDEEEPAAEAEAEAEAEETKGEAEAEAPDADAEPDAATEAGAATEADAAPEAEAEADADAEAEPAAAQDDAFDKEAPAEAADEKPDSVAEGAPVEAVSSSADTTVAAADSVVATEQEEEAEAPVADNAAVADDDEFD